MRLREIAAVDPPTPGFSMADAGAAVSFLPLDRVWHDSRFDPSGTVNFDGDSRSYNRAVEGDLLVPKVAPTFGHGRVAIARGLVSGRALTTSEVFIVRTSDHLSTRFLQYRLQAVDFISEGVASWTGVAGLKRISSDFLRDVRIDRDAWRARASIADFLDVEIARIDALVAARQRMIELLNERWAALRRTLTGVRQPDRPETSVQLRRVARLQAGAAFPHDFQGAPSGTIPYVKVGDLANVDEHDRLAVPANRVTPSIAADLRSPILPVGTIVLPKIGAALLNNRRAILSEPSCLDQNVMGITVTRGIPDFVHHCLAAIDLGDLSTPGPVPLLNEEAAKSLRIPWPTCEEQQVAALALRDGRRALLAPAGAVRRQIVLLRERRQALITAAVSGKLQVPDAPTENSSA